jgi:hypothetical protein
MKRYSISYAHKVNTKASKSGIKYHYSGRTDNVEKTIAEYKASLFFRGIRITDSETKKVVFEDLRKVKGTLTLTLTNGEKTWLSTHEYFDLHEMRRREHHWRYDVKGYGYKVVKVEREIF